MLLLNEVRQQERPRMELAEQQNAFLAKGGRIQQIEDGHSAISDGKWSLKQEGKSVDKREAQLAERIAALLAKGRRPAEICTIIGIPAATFDHICAKRRIFIAPRGKPSRMKAGGRA